MLKTIEFYLRIFAMFIWLMVICFVGIVICLFRPRHLNNNHIIGKMWRPLACWLANAKVEVVGRENFYRNTPCIYAANHQSALDVNIFGGHCPRNTLVIGKWELLFVPFFGQFFYLTGNVMIKRRKRDHSISQLDLAVEVIKKRQASIFIFPEGTRNTTNEVLMPFKKGAFHMAMQAGIPIVPMVVPDYRHRANPKTKTLDIGPIQLQVLEPQWPSDSVDEFAERVHRVMKEAIVRSAIS